MASECACFKWMEQQFSLVNQGRAGQLDLERLAVGTSYAEAWRLYELAVARGGETQSAAANLQRFNAWCTRSAAQGDANAQYNLGNAHAGGRPGVPQSYERAFELYKLSEAQGNAMATANLAACYANGWGVEVSYAEARRLYELAVARGDVKIAPYNRWPVNLQRFNAYLQQHCPLLGQRVVLRGLTTAASPPRPSMGRAAPPSTTAAARRIPRPATGTSTAGGTR